MKFLRPVVDINEQKIIKKQVLDEIIFIESFFVATRRFWIWNAASLPTIYTSSLPPFASRMYSS